MLLSGVASGLPFEQALAAVVGEAKVGVLPAQGAEVVDGKPCLASGVGAGATPAPRGRGRRHLSGAATLHRSAQNATPPPILLFARGGLPGFRTGLRSCDETLRMRAGGGPTTFLRAPRPFAPGGWLPAPATPGAPEPGNDTCT